MTDDTPLDTAHRAMQAAPDDDAARLGFYQHLADGELIVLLTGAPTDGNISPELLDHDGNRYLLAFDTHDRLSEFTDQPAPYAALPGRVIAGMLAGQQIGLGLNLGVAPSSILIPPAAMDWLAETLSATPEPAAAGIAALAAPSAASKALVAALTAKLANAGGLARAAWLAEARFQDGRTGLILAFIDAHPAAEPPLARAVQEALSFSGEAQDRLDVAFLSASDPRAQDIEAVARPIPLAIPETPEPRVIAAPGSDPDNPPKLR